MPSHETVERAVEMLRQTANYQYFFEQLKSADWIQPLLERGFFKNPPAPIHEGEYIRLPVWPETRYLARVAAQAPELTAQVLLSLPKTENSRVHEDIVDAANALPTGLAADFVPLLVGFLDTPWDLLLPEKLTALVLRLVEGHELPAALELARALLKPIPRERSVAPGLSLAPDPRPSFPYPEYEKILSAVVTAIAATDPRAAYELAAHLLEASVSISNPEDTSEDFSYIWRPAIEDSSRNTHYPDMRDDLVVALRNIAESSALEIRALVADLEARHWPVFRRLALHVLRVRHSEAPELVEDRALDIRRLFEPHVYHESTLLLREAFPRLDDKQRDQVVEAIEAGPTDYEDETAEETSRRRTYWAVRTLSALAPVLTPGHVAVLERLRGELGLGEEAFAEAEFSSSSGGGVWVGPTSPLTADEVLRTPDTDLLQFLSSWDPEDAWRTASPEGLGRALQEAVAREPLRFSHFAPQLLAVGPTYVRSALEGWRDALRASRAFDWVPVLALGDALSKQEDANAPITRSRDRDPDWSWGRRALAALLNDGLTISDQSIPFSERETAWAILVRLAEDADPTQDREEQYGGSNMDPATLAINTIRGQAMHAVIGYALWVRHHLGDADDVGAPTGFGRMPEVQRVLDHHLDRGQDPSLAVRSAYGQYFPWLHLLDAAWAESRVPEIFSLEQGAGAWFDAAWSAYVVYTHPYDKMAEVLRSVYDDAIGRLSGTADQAQNRNDPAEHLGEHLAVYVARGALAADDALVRRFFELAPAHVRGHLIGFLGRILAGDDPPDEFIARCVAFWEMRIARAPQAQEDRTAELAPFGWWFTARSIDLGWRMTHLLEVLRLTNGQIEHASLVLKAVDTVAAELPRDAVEVVQLIGRAAGEGWEILGAQEEIRSILVAGIDADPATKAFTVEVVHMLGARGYPNFRSVLTGR